MRKKHLGRWQPYTWAQYYDNVKHFCLGLLKLGLKPGVKFLVVGDKDVVILKAIHAPSIEEFDDLIARARKQARKAGMKRSDISKAVAKSRGRKNRDR